MAKKVVVAVKQYDQLSAEISSLLEEARRQSARSVNEILTATYWEVGRCIVEFEQGGEDRASYGEELLVRLADDLTKRFGKGFGWRNLFQMRSFYLAYPAKLQAVTVLTCLLQKTTIWRIRHPRSTKKEVVSHGYTGARMAG